MFIQSVDEISESSVLYTSEPMRRHQSSNVFNSILIYLQWCLQILNRLILFYQAQPPKQTFTPGFIPSVNLYIAMKNFQAQKLSVFSEIGQTESEYLRKLPNFFPQLVQQLAFSTVNLCEFQLLCMLTNTLYCQLLKFFPVDSVISLNGFNLHFLNDCCCCC